MYIFCTILQELYNKECLYELSMVLSHHVLQLYQNQSILHNLFLFQKACFQALNLCALFLVNEDSEALVIIVP